MYANCRHGDAVFQMQVTKKHTKTCFLFHKYKYVEARLIITGMEYLEITGTQMFMYHYTIKKKTKSAWVQE